MQLQITDVQLALAKLLNHYPEAGHNATSLAKLAFDWHDLLTEEGVTQKQFSAGVRHAVKTCRFFPKVADILQGVLKYRESPPVQASSALRIADTTSHHDLTDEEMARNRYRIAEITKMLRGEISIDQAVQAVESTNHINEFRGAMTKENPRDDQ